MKKNTILITLLLTLAFNPASAQIVFDFDTNAVVNSVPNGTEVSETISGVTLTISDTVDPFGDPDNITLIDGNGAAGTTGKNVSTGDTSTVTFTFSEAVDVHSVLVRDRNGGTLDLTFAPTGGSNAVVVVPLVNGLATNNIASLNWTEVTSFTVTSTGPSGEDYAFDDLSITPVSLPAPVTLFNFDTNAVQNTIVPYPNSYLTVTEEINGITLTVKDAVSVNDGNSYVRLQNSTWGGMSGQIATASATRTLTLAFSEVVDAHSLLITDRKGGDVDITFTPVGGSNVPVVVPFVVGWAYGSSPSLINLNWSGVTSIIITSSLISTNTTHGEDYGIDDVSVSASTLSTNDDVLQQSIKVYPNPVENIINITNVSDLKSITIYNSLGQLILQSKKTTIDISHLSKGLYFLKIQTSQGIETKRVVKE